MATPCTVHRTTLHLVPLKAQHTENGTTLLIACENNRPSSLPARVAFRVRHSGWERRRTAVFAGYSIDSLCVHKQSCLHTRVLHKYTTIWNCQEELYQTSWMISPFLFAVALWAPAWQCFTWFRLNINCIGWWSESKICVDQATLYLFRAFRHLWKFHMKNWYPVSLLTVAPCRDRTQSRNQSNEPPLGDSLLFKSDLMPLLSPTPPRDPNGGGFNWLVQYDFSTTSEKIWL